MENEKIILRDEKMERIKDMYNKPNWIISGNEENFEYAIKCKQTWGVQDKWFPQWKSLEKGNALFFYISGKIKRIVGVGKVENKFIQREPLWPDEIEDGRVKYPLRFEFTLDYLLNKKDWEIKGIEINNFIKEKLGKGAFADLLRGGISFIRYKEIIEFLYESFESSFDYKIQTQKIFLPETNVEIEIDKSDMHNHLQDLILQIGRLNKLLSEKEYSVDNMRLDAIWRRIEKGSPTYVFEIQVGGDIYHALSRLKHAYDLWNSNIFLIVNDKKEIYDIQKLLNGTFHEIKNIIKIIFARDIEELFKRKKSWWEYEKQLGIL